MAYIVYDKTNFSKKHIVETLEEAENLKNDTQEIIETNETNQKITKKGNKTELIEVEKEIIPIVLPNYILDIQNYILEIQNNILDIQNRIEAIEKK